MSAEEIPMILDANPAIPSEAYVRAALKLQNLPVPDDEIANVTTRFALIIKAFAEVESRLGAQIDAEDPVPPVYPHEV